MTALQPDDLPALAYGWSTHAAAAHTIRSEEHPQTRVTSVPVERLRFEKYIVTEEWLITVSVRREEVRLVREPILAVDTAEASLPSAPSPDADHSFILHEEHVVVTTTVVPTERVIFQKRRITEDHETTIALRKEYVSIVQDETCVGS